VEQQNIENHNIKNDTFIDRNPSSKTPAKQSSITMISQDETFSYLLLLFIIILSSKENSRGRSF
jgi:hypothetical protein